MMIMMGPTNMMVRWDILGISILVTSWINHVVTSMSSGGVGHLLCIAAALPQSKTRWLATPANYKLEHFAHVDRFSHLSRQ